MAETLEITAEQPWQLKEAWEMLGKNAYLYGDNGGEPDGNAWLPSSTISAESGKGVLAAGYGKMATVQYANDAAMLRVLGFAPLADGEEIGDELDERMTDAADEQLTSWARYDSQHWVYYTA